MQTEIYVPLLSALVGALIGSAGTVAAVWIQARREDRRDQRALAFQIASDQHTRHFEHVMKQGGALLPLDVYIAHSLALVRAAENGPLTADVLKRVSEELDAIEDSVFERESAERAKRKASSTEETP